MHARIIAALGIAFLSSACGDSPRANGAVSGAPSASASASAPKLGDPVLVRMEAEGGLRYEMAIALAGAPVDRMIEPVTTSLNKAVAGCPEVRATLQDSQIATVKFHVAAGVVTGDEDAAEPQTDCLLRALTRSGIATKETFDAMVQLRKPPGER